MEKLIFGRVACIYLPTWMVGRKDNDQAGDDSLSPGIVHNKHPPKDSHFTDTQWANFTAIWGCWLQMNISVLTVGP